VHAARAAAVAALLTLGSCSCTPEREGAGLDCFPERAGRWLSADAGPSEFEGRRDRGGPVTLYLDASGSMVGYIDGATETSRPLHDMIATIPGMFSGASEVGFRAFGTRVREIEVAERSRLAERDFYTCRGKPAAECDNQETRLDLVLREIEADADRLSIVVTDMWFSDPASTTTGLVPLAAPLENILASGRAVGVYGLPAPFRGTIHDLPGGGSTSFAGERPLIVLAIGPTDRVRRFGEQMARSPAASLARGFSDGSARQAIFTLNPSAGGERSIQPLRGGTDPRVQQAQILEAMEGVRVQQFRIQRSGAMREPTESTVLPAWEGPSEAAFLPNAVWRGPLAARLAIWERQGQRCSAEDWVDPVHVDGGWKDISGPGHKRFELDPGAFVAEFRRPGIYLVTAEVARTSLDEPNEATGWLRDWSFGGHQGTNNPTSADGAFFRTLHLAEFARLLENSLADAAERNPGPIMGFTFVVQVEG
jgi:hypothetical protein